MDELLEQFLIEGRELVQLASDDLMALESRPADAARIDSAFRAVHTLKGSVGFFDFAAMGRLLHAAEDLLSTVRGGRLSATGPIVTVLLDCMAASDDWLDSIERTGKLPPDSDERERALRNAMAPHLGEPEAPGSGAARNDDDTGWVAGLIDRNADAVAATRAAGGTVAALKYTPAKDCFFLGDDPMAFIRSVPNLIALEIGTREAPSLDRFDPFACNLVFAALSTAPFDSIRDIFRFVPDQIVLVEAEADRPDMPGQAAGDGGGRTLRVDAGRVDALVDIVGELVVAKNGLSHLAQQAGATDAKLARDLLVAQATIDRLVGDMHRAVMTMRMVPLAGTFRRFARPVREIAGRLGKAVTFEIAGEDVEADKSVADGLFEPLLHVLRNAIDHGIETGEARLAAQKPAAGRIALEARRAGDQIVIAVTDDGAGVDLDKVRDLAKSRNLMSEAAIDALDDTAALDLVFAPGFSTASAVTDVSGRGVGLDAVRSAIEKLGGRVELTSTPGAGSVVRLTLPQALTINTVVTVRVGGERFGVPIESVRETVRIAADRIVPIHEGEAFVIRNRTVPLLRLADLLGLPRAERGKDTRVVIVNAGDDTVGIEVDGIAETFDVLLRPMQGLLSGLPGLLGTALLGDGNVLMVLDLPELIG
jgi:two-component system chemotaxis sensor kinase CheA